jgi:hypothetical protein
VNGRRQVKPARECCEFGTGTYSLSTLRQKTVCFMELTPEHLPSKSLQLRSSLHLCVVSVKVLNTK